MITDITGTVLIPGAMGTLCPGSGLDGKSECCCDGCDYLQCCTAANAFAGCKGCRDLQCPHSLENNHPER